MPRKAEDFRLICYIRPQVLENRCCFLIALAAEYEYPAILQMHNDALCRIQIGANVLKSTLIEDIRVDEDAVTFTGRGFGHGVGMSQWGAYEMAGQGKSAREIIAHYFKNVEIVQKWR